MNETNETQVEKKKLTDFQLRIVQVVAGILCSAAMIVSIAVSDPNIADDNPILRWLFLIVFLVVIIGRRRIESHFQLRLNLFGLVLIDGLAIGILTFLVLLLFNINPDISLNANISDTVKYIIVVGIGLLVIILGVLLPLKRYFRRKEEGTLRPIRIEPEEPEESETDDDSESDEDGPLTIEQQIAAMTKELDDNNGDDQQ